MKPLRRLGVARTGTAVAAAAIVLAGCAAGSSGSDRAGSEQITLTVSTFGSFGYKGKLEKQYEKAHPNIDVVLRQQEMTAHHEQLAKHLAGGSGAADIEAVEVSYINQFRAQPENFYNLLEYGAGDIKDRWLEWKYQQAMAASGDYLIGLGTDIGGLAMCYRRDLFAEAGLPTDREEVSDLWPTWNGYVEAGKEFKAAGTDAKWVDSGTNIFNPVLRQQDQGFFSRQNELLIGSSSGARQAWETTMEVVTADLSAKLTTFQSEWSTGFQKSAFATVICPAWMMANIKEYSPDSARGKWDIADVPGGGGNWGGSFLAIPKQSEHPEEAYQLAEWLTAPEQQLKIFKNLGNLPSTPGLYEDPALVKYKDPFFNNAPVGEIFTQAAQEFEQQYQGPQTDSARTAMENVIRQVANDKVSPQQGWEKAVQKVKSEVG